MNTSSMHIQCSVNNNNFSNCSLPSYTSKGRLMAFNDKYLALAWSNAGEFCVSSDQPKNLNYYKSCFTIEKSNILDMEFYPFDSDILAIANENNSIYIVKISKVYHRFSISHQQYSKHNEKISFINFNPVASNIICSSTINGKIHILDNIEYKTFNELDLKTNPNSVLWNPDGSCVGCISTRKDFQVWDPRQNTLTFNVKLNCLYQNSNFEWTGNSSFASIGCNNNEHYLYLWDLRKINNFCSINTNVFSSDNYFSNMTLYANRDLKLMYTN